MTNVALILKIILCACAFTTAFLSVFKTTIDDHKRLTNHGKMCVFCVCITFFIGVGNEVLGLKKEIQSSVDKKVVDDRLLETQAKLDQASIEGKKRWEEAKVYMIEAENARRKVETIQEKLAIVQEKLAIINSRVSDPTVKRTMDEIKKLTSNDITATDQRLSTVVSLLETVLLNLGEIKVLAMDSKNTWEELSSLKFEVMGIKSNVEQVRIVVMTQQPDAQVPGFILDSGFFDSSVNN